MAQKKKESTKRRIPAFQVNPQKITTTCMVYSGPLCPHNGLPMTGSNPLNKSAK